MVAPPTRRIDCKHDSMRTKTKNERSLNLTLIAASLQLQAHQGLQTQPTFQAILEVYNNLGPLQDYLHMLLLGSYQSKSEAKHIVSVIRSALTHGWKSGECRIIILELDDTFPGSHAALAVWVLVLHRHTSDWFWASHPVTGA